MGGFIEPNMHPVIVHFGFALVLTALVVYILGVRKTVTPRGETLVTAGDWMLAFGSLAIIATAASGLWAYYTVAHDGPSHAAMTLHRNWALPSAGAVLLIGAWRWTQRVAPPTIGFLATFAFVCAALTATAWLGGKVVYEHGVGVQRLPVVTGDGHDHDHGSGSDGHDHGSADIDNGHETSPHDTMAMDAPIDVDASHPATPASIAAALGQALRGGDTARLEQLFAPDVIIAEGGGTERSFQEYASHHMISDMAYVGETVSEPIRQDVIASDDMAVIISEILISGQFRGQAVRNRMVETLTVQMTDSGWKIVHVHWSSAPAPEEPGSHSHENGDHSHEDTPQSGENN